jgi:hypothetical protein
MKAGEMEILVVSQNPAFDGRPGGREMAKEGPA